MNSQNVLFEEYESIKPILSIGQYALVKYQKKEKEGYQIMEEKIKEWDKDGKLSEFVYRKKKRGITNQRQSVIKEIQDIIELEKGGKINAKVLAMKLSHCDLETLYFMKSEGLDYRKRTGKPFSKYIYGSIKIKKEK